MVSKLRNDYNAAFTPAKYQAFLKEINEKHQHTPAFRVSETPIFVPNDLKDKLLEACEEIMDVICRDDFKERSQSAILAGQVVPNEDDHTIFLQMDFGICDDCLLYTSPIPRDS